LQEAAGGLRVTAQVRHAPPGRHGFHIHEGSSCAEAGQAAGGHFNPDAAPHGDLRRSGVRGAHAGDLGNLEVGPDGRGAYAALLPGLALAEGPRAVAGRAIILHADADDLSSQPTGNAGGRIGCGLIERAR
jgi:Cu-Zn family superoxide dismutase